MANIVLTERCNRKCDYCFASEHQERRSERDIRWDEIVEIADLLQEWGERGVGLLGGEPSLYHGLAEVIQYMLLRGLTPNVFTNGVWPEDLLQRVVSVAKGTGARFTVNLNYPSAEAPKHRDAQLRLLKSFGRQCSLGVNINRPSESLMFLSEIAAECELKDTLIRIGIAQPIAGGSNAYLRLEDYREIPEKLVALAQAVQRRNISISFDCGFPMCVFDDRQLGILFRSGARVKFYCAPALDFGVGRRVWSCFPLATRTEKRWTGADKGKTLFDGFRVGTEQVRKDTRAGVFEECGDCQYRERKLCGAGCVAHLL